jgi:hypothetical protein
VVVERNADEMRARCAERCRPRCVLGETWRDGVPPPTIFFFPFSKILILKNLRDGDRVESAQNPEPQGLTAKIFLNKELAADWEPLREAVVENWLGEPSRMW